MLKAIARAFVPAAKQQYGLVGDFASWQEASAQCGPGYAASNIVEKTVRSARRLRSAPVEPDAVSFRLLCALQFCMARLGERVSVLDFGGSCGAHYMVFRPKIPAERRITWTVVDLPGMVAAADEFTTDELRFSLDPSPADIVIASGSLQYCSDPYATLRELAGMCKYLIVAKHPMAERPRIAVQRVPPEIYDGAYPCWTFSHSQWADSTARMRQLLAWDETGYGTPGEFVGRVYAHT